MSNINWVELGESVRSYLAQRAASREDNAHLKPEPPHLLHRDESDSDDTSAERIGTADNPERRRDIR